MAAGKKGEISYRKLVSLGANHGITVTEKRISAWMAVGGARRPEIPTDPTYVRFVLLMTDHLEHLAQDTPGHRKRSHREWSNLLEAAQKERSENSGGRPRKPHTGARQPAPLPEFVLPGPHAELVRQTFPVPGGLQDRQVDLGVLAGFVTDRSPGARSYLYVKAAYYAGKTALMSWFVQNEQDRPADVDVVGYFVATLIGNNRADLFLEAMVGQLAAVAGRKKVSATAGQPTRELFHELCRAAAEAAEGRGRMLLMVVDGLDEDEDARLGGRSIAGYLPPRPPANLRIVVTGRSNRPVPDDVPAGHPLLEPANVHVLPAWELAEPTREEATRELLGLLRDRPIGTGIVGLITAARGGLSAKDLAQLLGVLPLDINERLSSLKGRSLAFDHTTSAADRTYVLGHDVLREAAVDQLGDLTGYEELLHAWADGYRDRGWRADTPPYLLHHYTTRMLRPTEDADAARLTAFALDPRRQQRLLAHTARDIALADLDRAAQSTGGHDPADLEVLAAVAASRDLINLGARPVPHSIMRGFARLGDIGRTRGLALASRYPVGKASALADVARTLAGFGHPRAPEVAREAEQWVRTALREAEPTGPPNGEAECAGETALALIASDQAGAARALLGAAGCGPWEFIAAAQACPPRDAVLAGELLDEAEARAEHAGSWDHYGPESVVDALVAIAHADQDRAERMYDRIVEHATDPKVGAHDQAEAACVLAGPRPAQAAHLAELARSKVVALLADPEHLLRLWNFVDTLDVVVRALENTGRSAEAERLRADVPEDVLAAPFGYASIDYVDDLESGAVEADDGPSVDDLAQEAFDLAEQGREVEARERLHTALRRHAGGGDAYAADRLRWLVVLAGALGSLSPPHTSEGEGTDPEGDQDTDIDVLVGQLGDASDQARAYAAASLGGAVAGRTALASRLAHAAARAARTLPESENKDVVRTLAAQALARAGEDVAAKMVLPRPASAGTIRAYRGRREEERRGRLGVLAGLGTHHPDAVARTIDARREKVLASAAARGPGIANPLPLLAELLTVVPPSVPGCRSRLLDAVRAAEAGRPESLSQRRQPENDLILALLEPGTRAEERAAVVGRLARAEQYAWQVDPELPNLIGFALVRAALGDLVGARLKADDLGVPTDRAEAFAAVAGHLVRLPAHLPTSYGRHLPYPDLPLLRALALGMDGADTPAPGTEDLREARSFVREALTASEGWYRALPVLAWVAPGAVRRVRDLTLTHLEGTAGRFSG
ncbi:hypothetical protein GCM10010425_30590 [Streptomyces spororaveus]|uniref:Nephrocystin 3-like N-terminal domain-containing protein n=1 Tax=Streptomyces spororaveus TaxID=284039 RepID=A0ABQ3T670_9ACTN|nr:hypothetical protein [Streptomyces spororaveus]GHI75882.1 hypothetical protein Sspor_14430 [Streptomyces spororaveus]